MLFGTASADFSPLFAGQAAALAREIPASQLTTQLMQDAGALLRSLRA